MLVIVRVWFLEGGICDTVFPPQEYEPPAIDDGKLEVVAIFGSVQMAMSRIINLHHHRIAQVGKGWVGTRKVWALSYNLKCGVVPQNNWV